MIRIDKSAVGVRSSNVIIKRWVKQDAAVETDSDSANIFEEHIDREEKSRLAAERLEKLAQKHAQKIIDDAQDAADLMLENAEKEVESMQQEAYKQGFAKGKAMALQQEEALAKDINHQFMALIQELRACEEERDAAMEENILRLSIYIAEKIVNVSIENDDKVFMGLVKEAVERLNAKEKFTIHLNQREYDRFFAENSGWLSDAIQSTSYSVTANASIPPGGLMIASQDGMVRAGVDTQLDKLKQALLREEE